MTPEQQRVAIAEARGYTHVRIIKSIDGSPDIGIGHHPTEPHSVPDYLNDLNACHEMEKVLIAKGVNAWWAYVAFINRHNPTPFGSETAVNATAAQKSKAFLQTLGLWTETPTQPQ